MQRIKGSGLPFPGWLFLAIGLLAGWGSSQVFKIPENERPKGEQKVALWGSNWPRLKQGMTKEQVLALVGAPNSTNFMEADVTGVSSNPTNPALEQNFRQTLGRIMNYAIWCYYGSQVIHTTPDEDVKTAMNQTVSQLTPLMNVSGERLQGHAIKFDQAGHVEEISQ